MRCIRATLQRVDHADELLGPACSLLPLGTAALTAGILLVNDAAAAPSWWSCATT